MYVTAFRLNETDEPFTHFIVDEGRVDHNTDLSIKPEVTHKTFVKTQPNLPLKTDKRICW